MKSLNEFYVEYITEGQKLCGTIVNAGQKLIVKNFRMPDKPDWEIIYVDKNDKNSFRGTNIYGCTIVIPNDAVKEVIPLSKDEKPKRKMSSEQVKKVKYEIADLEAEMQTLQTDMENDPEIWAENGQGGKTSDKYANEMNKIQSKIDKLKEKIGMNGHVIPASEFDNIRVRR